MQWTVDEMTFCSLILQKSNIVSMVGHNVVDVVDLLTEYGFDWICVKLTLVTWFSLAMGHCSKCYFPLR